MNKAFEDSGRHSEWPKVADTVIEAELRAPKTPLTLVAGNRKPAILHGQILATYSSDVVGVIF